MFSAQEPTAERRAVVDTERDISLEFIGGRGRIPGTRHTLTTRDLVVPFEVCRTQCTDADGTVYYLITFDSFGRHFGTPTSGVIEPVEFATHEERHSLQILAVEALLVFGDFYNGLARPDGYNRVDLRGQTYTLSSFGYEGASA